MTDVISALLPLYALVGIGIVVARVSTVTPVQVAEILIYVLTPSVLFSGAYTAQLDRVLFVLPVLGYVLSTFMFFGGIAISKRLFTAGDGTARITAYSVATGNTGYYGIPAVLAILGPDVLPIVVMFSFGITLFENTLGMYALQRHAHSPRDALLRVLKLPMVYALGFGLLLNVLDVPLPSLAFSLLDMLREAFVVLGMMLIGIALAGTRLTHFDGGFHLFVHTGKLICFPALAFVFVTLDSLLFGALTPVMQKVILIESMVPMAANVAAFAAIFGLRAPTASQAVMVSTCLSLALLPIGTALLFPLLK